MTGGGGGEPVKRLAHHLDGGEKAHGELRARHVVVDGLGHAHPWNTRRRQ